MEHWAGEGHGPILPAQRRLGYPAHELSLPSSFGSLPDAAAVETPRGTTGRGPGAADENARPCREHRPRTPVGTLPAEPHGAAATLSGVGGGSGLPQVGCGGPAAHRAGCGVA